ncbi:complex I subunit 5 family protein [Candidatus Nanosalina sp. VS9-1]|uniref:complex I subunit 5 family protein n=1 Tax=Candidatus Nanosalina sp. VS9-1 TaxID=3388566 RepID=UPI0039DFB949
MNQLIVLPLIVPLATAVLSILFRKTRFRDYLSIAGSAGYLIATGLLASRILSEGPISYQAGGWPAPYGITLVADQLSILMLLLTATVAFAANLYSWGYINDRGKESGYYAFLHFMVTGMSGAFITGDLFNLFVMFELVLMSSYALVAYSGSKESLFISMKYVVLNLIGSSLMLVAIGGLYSVTGTLNMADMALILSEGSVNMVPVLGLSIILFCVFAMKSGLVPFHFWAPPVYSNSPPPASALMAGISKKVGIYAVIRLYLTVFSSANLPETALVFSGQPVNTVIGYLVAVMASATVIIGGLGALNRESLDKLLSYSSVGQVGFIYIPISITMITGELTPLMASLIYILGHGLGKPTLFMISGIVEKITDTSNLEDLGGLSESSFTLSAAFFISAFSLVGIPPLLGFFAKFKVFEAALIHGNIFLVSVLFAGAVTTLLYFSKVWLKAFFGEPVETDIKEASRKEVFSVIILAVLILVMGIHFEVVYQLVEQAAESGLNSQAYIETVLGDGL